MKLIDNRQKAHKSFAVLLPFLATTIALLLSMITSLNTNGVIDVNNDIWWGYALTVLTYLGRIIPQIGLFFPVEDSTEKKDIE